MRSIAHAHLAHASTKPVVAATPAMGLTNVANAHAEIWTLHAVVHTFATVEARLWRVVGKVHEKPLEAVGSRWKPLEAVGSRPLEGIESRQEPTPANPRMFVRVKH